MAVLLCDRVEACGCVTEMDRLYEADIDQRLDGSIDRGQTDLWEFVPDPCVDVIDCWVGLIPIQEREDGQPLLGDAVASLTET